LPPPRLGRQGPAPPPPPPPPAAREFLERTPHRMTIDTELLRQFRLGRQPPARRINAGADLMLQPGRDLAPQRDAFVTQDRLRRHRNVIHAKDHSCNSWLDDNPISV